MRKIMTRTVELVQGVGKCGKCLVPCVKPPPGVELFDIAGHGYATVRGELLEVCASRVPGAIVEEYHVRKAKTRVTLEIED